MSEPVTNVEIEDVLSSIRRLVAEGDRSKAKTGAQDPSTDKLVLTPAFRVEESHADSAIDDEDFQITGDMLAAIPAPTETETAPAEVITTPDIAEVSTPEPMTREEATDTGAEPTRASLEETIAELEAAVTAQPDEWEPDGSEVTTAPTWASAGFGSLDAVEDAEIADAPTATDDKASAGGEGSVVHSDGMSLADALAAAASPRRYPHVVKTDQAAVAHDASDAAEDTPGDDQAEAPEPTASENTVEHVLSVLSLTDPVLPSEVSAEAVEVSKDAVQASEAPTVPVSDDDTTVTAVEEPTFKHSAFVADDPETDYGDDLADSIVGEMAEDEDLEAVLAKGALIEEDAIRRIIAEILQEELQGDLGERITRNVRKLVRREIYRVVNSPEMD